MDEQQLLALKPELDRFLDRFAPLFGLDGNQAHGRRFVKGSCAAANDGTLRISQKQ